MSLCITQQRVEIPLVPFQGRKMVKCNLRQNFLMIQSHGWHSNAFVKLIRIVTLHMWSETNILWHKSCEWGVISHQITASGDRDYFSVPADVKSWPNLTNEWLIRVSDTIMYYSSFTNVIRLSTEFILKFFLTRCAPDMICILCLKTAHERARFPGYTYGLCGWSYHRKNILRHITSFQRVLCARSSRST